MKKFYFLIVLLNFISFHVCSQSMTCAGAGPFCATGAGVTYPSPVGITNGGAMSCVNSTPNPSWFYIQSGAGGNLSFTISQTSSTTGGNIDVDFVLWGPFDLPTCSASNITNANMISCSFSVSGVENFSFNGLANKYYMLLITNFSEQAGQITLMQTNIGQPGSGTTSCNLVCPLSVYGGGAFCQGSYAQLTASIANATSYQWSSSVTGPIPGSTQSIVVTDPATYTVVVNKPGCTPNVSASATYTIAPPPNTGTPNNLTVCSPNSIFNLTLNNPVIQNGNTGIYIDYHTTQISAYDGFAGGDLIINPAAYNAPGPFPQTIYVSMEDIFSCIYTTSFQLNVVPSEGPTVSATIVNHTVTVTAVGNGNYQYSIDNGVFQNSPVFENVAMGSHIITVVSTNSCGSTTLIVDVVTPFAPIAVSPQYFNAGQTIQNLVASGQNIQWYANASDKNNLPQTMSTPLPLSTVLVDGVIYHASQTINGVESTDRAPVLALLSTMGEDEFLFSNFQYFPNPVKNTLNVSNSSIIDTIELTSILGQKIMSEKVNALQTEIDLTSLSNGIYIMNVLCEGHKKTVKIIKE